MVSIRLILIWLMYNPEPKGQGLVVKLLEYMFLSLFSPKGRVLSGRLQLQCYTALELNLLF